MRVTASIAMVILLAATAVGATPLGAGVASPAGTDSFTASGAIDASSRCVRVSAPARRALATTSASSVERVDGQGPWAASLGAIAVLNRNANDSAEIHLYDGHGVLDDEQAKAFMRVAASRRARAVSGGGDPDEPLDVRVVQLAMRAAYHFNSTKMVIVSATRPGARGKHGSGEALDFALDGVRASVLAAYLRGTPRAGVGIYTNPSTQYVHLDVREESYHWLDASPPGIRWREQLLPDPKRAERDAAWTPWSDLPERASRAANEP